MASYGPGQRRVPLDEALPRAQRRKQMADMYLAGRYQWEIAESFNLDPSMVSKELKALHEEWVQAAVIDINARKMQELDRVDLIERAYWEAWEKSKRPREKTSTRTRRGPQGDQAEAGVVKTESPGDPKFLQGVQWCVTERCKLLGLYAPEKHALTNPEGTEEANWVRELLTHDDTREIFAVLTDRLGGVAGQMVPRLPGDGRLEGPLEDGSAPEPAQPPAPEGIDP